jgi:hypothetical protein
MCNFFTKASREQQTPQNGSKNSLSENNNEASRKSPLSRSEARSYSLSEDTKQRESGGKKRSENNQLGVSDGSLKILLAFRNQQT